MKKLLLVYILCLPLLVGGTNSCRKASGQGSGMREVQNNSYLNNQAPPECLAVFRALLDYIRKPEPSIVSDQQAQDRWLSNLLRKAIADHVKHSGSPKDNPAYPSNSSFVGAWNYPTTFSIIGSRHYDYRNSDNPDDNRAVVDVLYEWDTNGRLNNQYPGSRALKSFVFVFEDGAWKLDDIYTFSDEYASPGSLRSYFSKR
jgi:hypothetical protein